jgi:hypothetical protein
VSRDDLGREDSLGRPEDAHLGRSGNLERRWLVREHGLRSAQEVEDEPGRWCLGTVEAHVADALVELGRQVVNELRDGCVEDDQVVDTRTRTRRRTTIRQGGTVPVAAVA